ncbi:hypothetical protein ABOZ73_06720 [Caulobacter sp. 73W]|uniref:Uncharacterized protein n=1 Tax=Caulobacter sp. 73W TaxID=3161137 RepID=A0AB39KXX5_9CAUL
MKRRAPARFSSRRLLVLMTITLSSLPLVAAAGSLIAAPYLGDAQFIVEVLLPAAMTFAAGNAMALIMIRRCGRRPVSRPASRASRSRSQAA